MKRKIFSIILVVLLSLSVAFAFGCNDNKEEQNPEEYFKLEQNGDSYVLYGVNYYIDDEVVIPATYNGLKIKAIGESAFEDADWLTEITLPEGIEEIGDNAFKNCTDLKEITIPKSVVKMGNNVFENCANLEITMKITKKPADWSEGWCGNATVIWEKEPVTEPEKDDPYKDFTNWY